jgi:hypothetical protein
MNKTFKIVTLFYNYALLILKVTLYSPIHNIYIGKDASIVNISNAKHWLVNLPKPILLT